MTEDTEPLKKKTSMSKLGQKLPSLASIKPKIGEENGEKPQKGLDTIEDAEKSQKVRPVRDFIKSKVQNIHNSKESMSNANEDVNKSQRKRPVRDFINIVKANEIHCRRRTTTSTDKQNIEKETEMEKTKTLNFQFAKVIKNENDKSDKSNRTHDHLHTHSPDFDNFNKANASVSDFFSATEGSELQSSAAHKLPNFSSEKNLKEDNFDLESDTVDEQSAMELAREQFSQLIKQLSTVEGEEEKNNTLLKMKKIAYRRATKGFKKQLTAEQLVRIRNIYDNIQHAHPLIGNDPQVGIEIFRSAPNPEQHIQYWEVAVIVLNEEIAKRAYVDQGIKEEIFLKLLTLVNSSMDLSEILAINDNDRKWQSVCALWVKHCAVKHLNPVPLQELTNFIDKNAHQSNFIEKYRLKKAIKFNMSVTEINANHFEFIIPGFLGLKELQSLVERALSSLFFENDVTNEQEDFRDKQLQQSFKTFPIFISSGLVVSESLRCSASVVYRGNTTMIMHVLFESCINQSWYSSFFNSELNSEQLKIKELVVESLEKLMNEFGKRQLQQTQSL